jgi:hypothetical protein
VKQPLWAPPAVGSAVVTGLCALIVGAYRITDCLRYERGRGACDTVVAENVFLALTGGAALWGPLGGLFTYNRKLERPLSFPAPQSPETVAAGLTQAFRSAVAAGEVSPSKPPGAKALQLPAPPPPPAKAPKPPSIQELHQQGWSQARIATHLGLSRYKVRKALNTPRERA